MKGHTFILFAATVVGAVTHGRYEVPDDRSYTDEPWPVDAKNYAAMTAQLHSDVGKIFTLLKKLDIDERTIVFFCSGIDGISMAPALFGRKQQQREFPYWELVKGARCFTPPTLS